MNLLSKSTNFIFALLSVILLSSCAELSYDHPMPAQSRSLKEIPTEFRGFYVQVEDENSTLNVTDKQFMTAETTATLGDDFVLRPFQKYLVVNIKSDKGWVVYLAEKTDAGNIRLYHTDVSDNEMIEQLKTITKVETVYDENNELEKVKINPTDAEFKLMVESNLFEATDDFVPHSKP